MKSPSDINDKKLNGIVSVLLFKSKKNDYGNYHKLLIAKLQIKPSTTDKFIINIEDIVLKNKSITTKLNSTENFESEVRSFQKASSLIMLHRLSGFCQHKKQQQQHKQKKNSIQQQEEQALDHHQPGFCHQQKQQVQAQDHYHQDHHHKQIQELLDSKSPTTTTTITENEQFHNKKYQASRKNNNNIAKNYIYNTKSTTITTYNNYYNNINSSSNSINISNIIRTDGESIASSTSVTTITPKPSLTIINNRLSSSKNTNNNNNTNNKHINSYRINQINTNKNNNNNNCWNRNRYRVDLNNLRKNCKLFVFDCNQFVEKLFSSTPTSDRKFFRTTRNKNLVKLSLFFPLLSSSLLSLSSSLKFSSFLLPSSLKQYACWCFLLPVTSNFSLSFLLSTASVTLLSSSTTAALAVTSKSLLSSSFLLNALKFVANHV